MGIEPAHIEAIIEAHAETVDALKAERDKYKAQAEEVPDLQRRLGEAEGLDGKLAELQTKYDEVTQQLKAAQDETKGVQESFDEYKSGVEAREASAAKAKAYRTQVLQVAGISSKYLDDVMGVTPLDDIKLDDDGNVEGADELVKGAKSKWKAFVTARRTDNGRVDTPPKDQKGGPAGAHERAVEINRQYRERMYGAKEEA